MVFVLLAAGLVIFVWRQLPKKRSAVTANTSSSVSAPSGNSPAGQPINPATEPGVGASRPPLELSDKTASMQAIWAGENAKAQDFYGRVMDQYGNPVTEVEVTGNLALIKGFDVPERKTVIRVLTDAKGEFQITGIRGWELGVIPRKLGYELASNTTARTLPPGGKTSPALRAVFTMWKLKAAEPMVHKEIVAGLPCDGSAMTLDLLTGRRVANGGDLTIRMTRKPINIDRSGTFDWSVNFTVNGGGLVEISDLYPNEAPVEGYEPSITRSTRAGPPYFTGNALDQWYYLKSRDGQVFGRVRVHITADYQPPPVRLEIDAFVNPSASRNLQYDPSSQLPGRR